MTHPGSLWQKVMQTTEQALASGALQPIATQLKSVPDSGIPFEVRILDSLSRKEAQKKEQKNHDDKPFNPFLPYEEALFVDQLFESHICLLNKFNVVDHHLLIVTRDYESQNTWLTLPDFAALTYPLSEIEGLGFYNGGTQAGASQHHKHLQLVPLVSPDEQRQIPLETLLTEDSNWRDRSQLPQLPFWHSLRPLSVEWTIDALPTVAKTLHDTYCQIMADLGLDLAAPEPDLPYNLLITRRWMLGVRRSLAEYEGIGVNSLGYAGWLLVKDWAGLEQLEAIGPLQLLHKVSVPLPAPQT